MGGVDGIDCQQLGAHGAIVPGNLDTAAHREHIHFMMTSSSDELIHQGAESAVSIDHLTVVRGKRNALDDVSVRIARGTITGLLGPSGCGKTTLMRCVVGTQLIASGTVTVLGRPAGSAELRSRVGYVTQDPTIYDDLRVIDNVRYFASLYGTEANAADDAVSAVGLTDHRTALCGNLSGGQRTRASLACALVTHPELLVLDEPTVGLDPVLRVDLWDQFHELARRGTTLLVSSHVMDEADHCGDLLLMREGRLLAHTTPQKLREETGCTSLEEAFLSVIRHSTAGSAAG
jgi:ABC-2 type transport system ATP-binding protein